MSRWQMRDELEKMGGTYEVPYGNTIRITLGDYWAQYSVGEKEDFNIELGSLSDAQINVSTIGRLPLNELKKTTFLLRFALDRLEAERTYFKIVARIDETEES